MNANLDQQPDDTQPNADKPTRRGPPKGPLVVMLVVMAVVALMYLLMRTTPPKPLPEIPPHRQVPADWHHPQDPRPDPEPARETFEP